MLTMKKFNEFKLADQDIVHSTFYDNMHGIIHGSLPLTIYTFFNIIMDYLRLDRKQTKIKSRRLKFYNKIFVGHKWPAHVDHEEI